MWVKRRISSYRFSKINNYADALEKTVNILKKKFGDNKVFLSEENDKSGKKHIFIKANLKKEESNKFNTIYDDITTMFFAGKSNQKFDF
ncbi:hypothetical protein [Orenia marismortui]|uniref:hypothetical protein n=1 Tax=Orenia marismortui TaxID=46469 RepID=UPI000371C46D|nr:hypothetical protein [Orenia marismortui]